MSTTIYYFSGTGNSFKVAKDLNSQLGDSNLVRISKKNLAITQDILSEKIGIVYPIYFSGIPAMVKRFLEDLQVNKDTYIFTVATFGGSMEISFDQIDDILSKKGSHISASFKIAMPGSYQILYDVNSEEKQTKLFNNEKEQILKISASINKNEIDNLNGKVKGIKKALCELIYSAFKPYTKDKNFWTTEKCNGCGTCSKVCPASNIEMLNGKPQWKHQCEACMACMQWCPQKSIQYKKNTLKRGRYHHPEVKSSELFQNN
jgi:MinD superfamily P-loop ATPase